MPEGALRVTRTCVIPLDELEWEVSTPGGPGGQHANRARTRVEVRFDVASSRALGPRQRARLLERFGSQVRAAAGERRSQHRNRELALERLRSRIAAGLRVAAPRTPTRPPRAAVAARVERKRRQGEKKRLRRPPSPDD